MKKQLIFFTAINISQENGLKILLILLTIVLKALEWLERESERRKSKEKY